MEVTWYGSAEEQEALVKRCTLLERRVLGYAMSAFFGGRADARIVRVPVPVAPVDATSMYPLVHANLGTWHLLTARAIRAVDAREAVRSLLARGDLLEGCLDCRFWRRSIGVTLVELEDVAGSILPVRAAYDPYAADPGIGVNPLYYKGRLWYMLPDVIASVLLSGIVPHVRRAIRLIGIARQPGLHLVRLRGHCLIDPLRDDPFVVMIDERQRVRQDRRLPDVEREWRQRSYKITANSGVYGVPARFDRREVSSAVEVLVYGPDDRPLRKRVEAVEDPGPYAFPPIAASITAGARLMLALLECLVRDAGGTYAYCDTDSMAIVATEKGSWLKCPTSDGSNRICALSFETVRGIIRRFDGLIPFDRALVPAAWKVEHDAMRRPLCAYAISAKRYALFRLDAARSPELVDWKDADHREDERVDASELADWSEHGLGLYQSPLVDERRRPLRDADGRLVWIREAWTWVLERALGKDAPLPAWTSAYALAQFSLSTPRVADWFKGRDAAVAPEERMRPGSFGLLAHPHPFLGGVTNVAQPAAPFERDPTRWDALQWYDRTSGRALRVMRWDPNLDRDRLAHLLSVGVVPIRTLADVLEDYMARPEHKSLAPDGSKATGETRGPLRRRPVVSNPARTRLAGKEGDRLLERASGIIMKPEEYPSDYGTRVDEWNLAKGALEDLGARRAAALSGVPQRTVQRAMRSSGLRLSAKTRERLIATAATYAQTELGGTEDECSWCLEVLHLYRSAQGRKGAQRVCTCGCGKALPTGRSKWFSEACRVRTHRRRTGSSNQEYDPKRSRAALPVT